MLERLADVVLRRRKLVLVLAALLFGVAGGVGGGVAEHLSSGGFEDPGAESTQAEKLLVDHFEGGQPNLLLLVTAKGGSVDDPAVRQAGLALTQELGAEADVVGAVSYWTLGDAPPLKNEAGNKALVLARVDGTQDEINDRMEHLSPTFTRSTEVLTVGVGGFAEVFREVGETIEADLAKAEAVALPITLLLLVLVFGSVVAATLPLAVGGLAIIGTFLVLRLLTTVTEVSIFSLNMTTAMGLGLAIDYSLFIVARFREELRQGVEVAPAIRRTVATAGRTVVFSAVTVAASLAALLVFPLAFLRSFAYAGIAVVALAAVASVVVLPALLAVIGHKVDALVLFRRRPKDVGEGFWHRVAMAVMKRPLPVATAVTALLLLLGAPFLGVQFGLPDDRVLHEGASSRQVTQAIREEFGSNEAGAISAVAWGIGDPSTRTADIERYATDLSTLDGVTRVDAMTGTYIDGVRVFGPTPLSTRFRGSDGTFVSAVPSIEPLSPEGEALVKEIRSRPAPFPVQVTGFSAQLVDSKESLFSRLPLAGGVIALVTFIVLFLAFGSLLVPAKAVVLNLLSLTATFGAMVWVFQDGNLSGALDFTATGMLDTTTPILMFCIAFGLSMDYEVFLLSRIKEEHDLGADNVTSVAVGLERTGRIVTAAAALIAVVFIATGMSRVTFIKLFGLGMALAVLMDATLIRATLVPAFMRVAGDANWWAPAPLRRFHQRWGVREDEAPREHEPEPAGVAP
jgi:RND superfamily putative drug exporter